MNNKQRVLELLNKTTLSNEEIELVINKITITEYQKGDQINSAQNTERIYVALSGAYRTYRIKNRKKNTVNFYYENKNQFITYFLDLTSEIKTTKKIECLKNGEVLTLNLEDLLDSPNYQSNFDKIIAKYNYILAKESLDAILNQNTKEKCVLFLKSHPNLLNMIPLNYIASYLNVSTKYLNNLIN